MTRVDFAVRRSLGLALVAAATLTAEVALTRILSAGLFHHFAFVVVSTALFGTALGGLGVTILRDLRSADAHQTAGRASMAFAVGLPILYTVSQWLPLEPLSLLDDPSQILWLSLVYVALAIPFAASGLAIALILDRHAAEAPGLYAADLAGASVGCFAALAALHFGPSGLYAASLLAWAAAVAFGVSRRLAGAAAIVLAIAPLALPLPLHISRSKITVAGEPYADLLIDPARTLKTGWGPLGRVDLVRARRGRQIILDAGAAAVRIAPLRSRFSPSDATLPYELRAGARVLVIGAGAGWEVAHALQFGAEKVDAVEINPLVAEQASARLRTDPRVTWHITDGRSFLHRSQATYDAIFVIHTISNAATAAGAMRLAEDYLLTVNALRAMLERLNEGGLLLLTRPETQIANLVWHLRHASVEAHQLWCWTDARQAGFYAAVMVKAGAPWTDRESQKIRDRLNARRLTLVFDPKGGDVSGPTADRIRTLLSMAPPGRRTTGAGAESDQPARTGHDFEAPRISTDDRPYFHQHRSWARLHIDDFRSEQNRSRMALEDKPLAEASLVLLFIETTVVAALVLLVPLFADPHRRRRETISLAVHFGALGLAFMTVEVSLVQRLGLMMGSPTLAFSIVFAGLLAGTAAGSALSGRWPVPRHACFATAVTVLALAMTIPSITQLALPQPLVIRAGLALITVFVAGLFMGLPFPLGMRAVGGGEGAAAWALAFNGVASVAGTGLAIVIGSQLGLTASLISAAVIYLVAWGVPPRGAPSEQA